MSCNGDCCVAFRVPFDLVELARGDVGPKSSAEAIDISAMLIPISPAAANVRLLDLIRGDRPDPFPEEEDGHLYKCRHWNERTRRCGNYENRPPMCSTFPYGQPCRYGCGERGEVPDPGVIV